MRKFLLHLKRKETLDRGAVSNYARGLTCCVFADGWNLITQDALEVMSVCEELGIAVHLAGIFGGTTVSPIFDPMPEHAEQVAAWQALADRHGVSLAAVALGFAALPKCVEKLVVRPHFPWRFRKSGKTKVRLNRIRLARDVRLCGGQVGMRSVADVERNVAQVDGGEGAPH